MLLPFKSNELVALIAFGPIDPPYLKFGLWRSAGVQLALCHDEPPGTLFTYDLPTVIHEVTFGGGHLQDVNNVLFGIGFNGQFKLF